METTHMFQQAPLRNESMAGDQVYSHSGEFSPQVVDVTIPGRGVSFQFIRKYSSSRHKEIDSLGHGWTFTYAKRLEREGKDILYHDGEGRIHRFTHQPGKNHYRSPDGLYAVLIGESEKSEIEKFVLRQRFGTTYKFEEPADGGRLLAIEDRNGNALNFKYTKDALRVSDPLGHQITLTFHQHRVVRVQDHADRVWHYNYNEHDCLIEVIQPPTDDFPGGLSIQYGYDEAFRLTSVTDAKGQTFLRNSYDKQGRIERQDHGNGVFQFQYETIGTAEDAFPIYRTHVQQKNGAQLLLTHNATGQVVERSLFVSAASLSPEDHGGSTGTTIPLTTTSKFNRHGESVERIYPAGNRVEWQYDEKQADLRAQGTMLRVTHKPAPGVESDQEQITTRYTYEPQFQQLQSITDPRGYSTRFEYDGRGNMTQKIYPPVTVQTVVQDQNSKSPIQVRQLVEKFTYNVAGQIILATDARGAATEYHYYPANDPSGANGLLHIQNDAHQAGGYLARIVRDPVSADRPLKSKPAHLVTIFGYDVRGNLTTIQDGKSNSTRLRYDSHDQLLGVTSRQPFNFEVAIQRDANRNLAESKLAFDHIEYDPVQRTVTQKSSTISQTLEYNALNNPVRRISTADGTNLTETLTRDADENIIRSTEPLGNVTEFTFDERNLLLKKRLGAGSPEEATILYTHTLNGRGRSITDGRGNTTHYHYDGFHRSRGFTNAGGAMQKQRYDAEGNITHIEVTGDLASVNEQGQVNEATASILLKTVHQYDELNRRIRTNRAWLDVATSTPLGKSQWDGQEGIVSTLIEYDDNRRPLKIWDESGNIQSFEYDGANRVVASSDGTGESLSIDYDENSNPVRFARLGPEVGQAEERFQQIITQQFDALDRLAERSVNEEPPETLTYDALGRITTYTNQAGIAIQMLQDAFGRWTGQATTAMTPPSSNGEQRKQLLVQRVERDDNNRIVTWINAADHRMQYQYDALNRRTASIYPDGTIRHFEHDENGNIVRILDPNVNVIIRSFDPLNRLVERRIEPQSGGSPQIEQFHYNGLNHLVAGVASGTTIARRYDSLSRVLEESQTGRTIRYGYDSAGNRTHLTYPSGQEVHKTYDVLKRVSEVRDGDNKLIAQYTYRSRRQLLQKRLGTVLEATYTYKPCQCRLSSVTYRSTADGRVVDGNQYLYDVVGNRTQEVQLHISNTFGDRFVYDTANRLINAQYGVENLNDPTSKFDHEVQYELDPVGTWQKQTTLNPEGQTLFQLEGKTNQRDVYQSLGERHFTYDANGNRSLEENDPDANCPKKLYTYDYANRLIKVECLVANGNVNEATDYTYDAFSRQVLKRLTNAQGEQETARVWNDSQLIEEWEGDNLARSFVYGAKVNEPVKMNRQTANGVEEFFYTFNGRGSVSALVTPTDLVAERYTYDIFGQPFLTEVNGEPVGPIELVGQPSYSPVSNPFFTGGQLWDSDTRLVFKLGKAFDPSTAQFVQGVSNETNIGDVMRDTNDDAANDNTANITTAFSRLPEEMDPQGAYNGTVVGSIMLNFTDDDMRSVVATLTRTRRDDPTKDPLTGKPIPTFPLPPLPPIPNPYLPGNTPVVPPGPPPPLPPDECDDPKGCPGTLPDPPKEPDPPKDDPGIPVSTSGDNSEGNNAVAGGDDGLGGAGGCFVRGTLVATERGLLPIEQIQVADDIYAFDLSLRERTVQKVVKIFEAPREVVLVLDFGAEEIRCTPAHRFYTGQWVPARELSLGDLVLSLDGQWKELKGIRREIQPQSVFNLKVEEMHNYFVGQSGLLVHNDKSATGGDPETQNEASS
jgi:YD repeat-containing protein